jgi:hypothetical protein
MKPIPEQKFSAFKVGPNKMDQGRIQAMAAEGLSASSISQKLKIQLDSVKGWMPKKKKKAKPQSKEA